MRIKELCEESMEVLGKVDPGYPLWKAETLKDLSTAMMNLARYDGNKKLYFVNINQIRKVNVNARTITLLSY